MEKKIRNKVEGLDANKNENAKLDAVGLKVLECCVLVKGGGFIEGIASICCGL